MFDCSSNVQRNVTLVFFSRVILLVSIISCVYWGSWEVVANRASASDAKERWLKIVEIQNDEEKLTTSIWYEYSSQLRQGSVSSPRRVTNYKGTYARQGTNLFYDGSTEHVSIQSEAYGGLISSNASPKDSNIPVGEEFRVNFVFDGEHVFVRQPGMLARSRQRQYAKPASPLSHNVIQLYDNDRINSLIEEGQYEVRSIERDTINGHSVEKVTFFLADGNKWLEIWYDMKRGALPIQSKSYTQDGVLVGIVRDVEIASIEVDGNILYYPLQSVVERFDAKGESVFLLNTSVDTRSLKINHDLSAETFQMKLNPGEMLYDVDLEIAVVNPGNNVRLDDDFQAMENFTSALVSESNTVESQGDRNDGRTSRYEAGKKIGKFDELKSKSNVKIIAILGISSLAASIGIYIWSRRRKVVS